MRGRFLLMKIRVLIFLNHIYYETKLHREMSEVLFYKAD